MSHCRLQVLAPYHDDLRAAGLTDTTALRAFADRGTVVSEASSLVLRHHTLATYGTYAKLYFYGPLDPRYFVRPSRAWREFRSYEHLGRIGLRCPDVICVAEQRQFGCVRWALIVTREIPAAENLLDFFGHTATDTVRRAAVIRRLAEAAARMHNRGFFHRTLRFRNTLIPQADGDAWELYFIDCPAGHAWSVSPVHDSLFDLVCLYKDFHALCRPEEWSLFLDQYSATRDRDLRACMAGIPDRCRRRFGERPAPE